MRIFFVFIICTQLFVLNAQKQTLDGLSATAYNKSLADTTRLIALIELGRKYQTLELDSAESIFLRALAEAKRINNNRFLFPSYMGLGNTYKFRKEYLKSLDYLNILLSRCLESKDDAATAKAYNALGQVYAKVGDYNKATEFYFKNLDLCEKMGQPKLKKNAINNLGNVFYKTNNFQDAIKYYYLSLEIVANDKDTEGMIFAYHNLSEAYLKLKNYDSSFANARKCIRLNTLDDNYSFNSKSYSLISKLFGLNNKKDSCIIMLDLAIDACEKLKDKVSLSEVLCVKAEKLLEYKRTDEALATALLAKEALKGITLIGENMNVHGVLYKIYKEKGRSAEALTEFEKFSRLKDSSEKLVSANNVTELAVKHEYKEKRLADSLQLKNEKQLVSVQLEKEKQMKYGMYIVVVLILVFSFFLYNRYRITRNQKKIIEVKEQETAKQKVLLEHKQKEILDSIHYAKKIQMAQVPSEKRVGTILDKLKRK